MNITKLTLTRGEKSIEFIRGGKYHLTQTKGLSGLEANHRNLIKVRTLTAKSIKDSIYEIRAIEIEVAIQSSKIRFNSTA